MATRPSPAPLSPESTTEPLALAARIAGEHIDEVADLALRIAEQILHEIPDLGEGDDLLEQVRASNEANLLTIFWMLAQGVPADRAEAPAAALQLVREIVRRGGDLSAIHRAYRFGLAHFSSWWIERLTNRVADSRLLSRTVDSSLTFVFTYIDHVIIRLTDEHARERERWVRSSAALRAEVVGTILGGQEVEVDPASTRLGYELRRNHLGLVIWAEQDPENTQIAQRLERVATRLAEAVGCGRPLLVPAGGAVLWAWISAHEPQPMSVLRDAHEELAGAAAKVWVATGNWADGVDGLRRTHEDALQARRVVRDGQHSAGTLTAFDEVAIASLLGGDLVRARRFVLETLGPLAAPDEPATRLRETLAAFLDGGSSHVAAARRLHVHQNTVAYRVRRAEELLSTPVAHLRLELELALALTEALGPAVLGRVGR